MGNKVFYLTMGMVYMENTEQISLKLRQSLMKMLHKHKAGHIPSCFSMVDFLTVLYYSGYIKYKIGDPKNALRDKIIISKGHAAMALYPIFADFGFFDPEELERFTQPDGLLGLYADYRVPGIEGISGSLGHGIGMAAGFILSDRMDKVKRNVFVVIGDGECYEGSIWEAAMFAAHHQMGSMKVILDRNKLCILGRTEDLLDLGDLKSKWESFGWNAVCVDGHNHKDLNCAFQEIMSVENKPSILIADTTKGKGISFMEGNAQWHNKIPSDEQFRLAFVELGMEI